MKVRELGRFIRDQRSSLSLSLRNVSGLTGVSIPYLSQIERGLRRPSADILNAIAKALRVSSETLYVKAGILDERGGATDPVGEILRDLEITDQQKRILIDLYQSFRGDGAASKPQARSAAAKTTRARPASTRRVTARSVSKPGKTSGRAKPVKTSKSKPAKKKTTRPSARKAPAKKTTARKRRTTRKR